MLVIIPDMMTQMYQKNVSTASAAGNIAIAKILCSLRLERIHIIVGIFSKRVLGLRRKELHLESVNINDTTENGAG